MTAMLSLRSRVLLGAVLWTIGLFMIIGAIVTVIMVEYPQSPRIFHNMFAHDPLSSIVAALCLVGGLWQVRKGLAPLNDLRVRLSHVRDGRAPGIEGSYPAEVQPLVDDLNALLDHRERAVSRALAKAGDLAHGLKTPLAVLAQEAARTAAAGHPELASTIVEQVERMRRQMDYHLAHARAAASGATPGARAGVRSSAEGLTRTLLRLYADRGIAIEVHASADHHVRVQREDLDEMLGNLLDNACKWGTSRVAVQSSAKDGRLTIDVDDDGPGVAAEMRDQVLGRGTRADEAAPGSGFGLAIVRDLADLYGGSIALDKGPLGGLRARLELPAA